MSNCKIVHNQKVRVKSGFFKGTKGIVKAKRGYEYRINTGFASYIWVNASEIEPYNYTPIWIQCLIASLLGIVFLFYLLSK